MNGNKCESSEAPSGECSPTCVYCNEDWDYSCCASLRSALSAAESRLAEAERERDEAHDNLTKLANFALCGTGGVEDVGHPATDHPCPTGIVPATAYSAISKWRYRAEAAESRAAKLEEAIRPFAEYPAGAGLTLAHYRAARDALGEVSPPARMARHTPLRSWEEPAPQPEGPKQGIVTGTCEAGRPEIDGECDCQPPESLEDDPPDIIELLEATNKGEHVPVFHGDMRRTGVFDRYSWSCRCGAGSKRANMTVKEAQADFAQHAQPKGASDAEAE